MPGEWVRVNFGGKIAPWAGLGRLGLVLGGLGPVWARLEAVWGPPGKQKTLIFLWFLYIFVDLRNNAQTAVLGSSWGPLGPSWGPLGPSWGPLGPSWGPLGPSWRPLGLSWGPFRGGFEVDVGPRSLRK